jgi:hypothetical protein
MTALILSLVSVIALGAIYVVAPVVLQAYRRSRGSHLVGCPETGELAEIELDATHAALTAAFGEPRRRVAACSRWPERRDCGQECLAAGERPRAAA